MADTQIIVIDGNHILARLDSEYERKYSEWQLLCSAVRAGFKKKTSRTIKNGKEYESTNWYMEQPGGGLKSVGKEEPDYRKYYPPKPKPACSFGFQRYDEHVLLEKKDYEANLKLFKEYLAFPLEECQNRIHPLYKNPQKALNSVSQQGMKSEISSGINGQKKDYPSCKTEKDEKGRCIVLTGMTCPVLCCRECRDSCNSRCSNSKEVC